MGPIGVAGCFFKRDPDYFRNERAICNLIAEAAHHGGNLRVEKRFRDLAEQIEEDFVVLPARVHHF